jgi:predicted metal-binding membrane protein
MLNETQSRLAAKRERRVVFIGLAGVSLLAWVYTLHLASVMQTMTMMGTAMPQVAPWGAPELGLTFAMWAVMMVAMMLPSAAPVTGLLVGILSSQHGPGVVRSRTAVFLAGYLAVWTGFAALATAAQWGAHTLSLAQLAELRPTASALLSGALLAAAGLFQWTPLKRACLALCRSPQGFFITEWRDGLRGAWHMGLKHGLVCVGCCWLLMTLLLLTGAMNLLWMAGLTAFILVEKIAPAGAWLSRAGGGLLLGAGLLLAAGALL